jgi:hypothetical protein
MTTNEKEELKLRFGMALLKVIHANKEKADKNKEKGIKDLQLIDSLRKLESASGIPYASIHRIAAGTKNAGFTTVAAIIEGLGISLTDFFSRYYYAVTDYDIEFYRKEKMKKKKSLQKKKAAKK